MGDRSDHYANRGFDVEYNERRGFFAARGGGVQLSVTHSALATWLDGHTIIFQI